MACDVTRWAARGPLKGEELDEEGTESPFDKQQPATEELGKLILVTRDKINLLDLCTWNHLECFR